MIPLFGIPTANIRIATSEDAVALANFCHENSAYDVFLTGEVPVEAEWVEDFLTDLPPQEFNWRATYKLVAVATDEVASIIAIIDVTLDMLAKGVGHIGMFQVAERCHGTGLAHDLYRGLEEWLVVEGTRVIRLGVLAGNPRGLAFWTRHGYRETRTRIGTAPTGKQHHSHVMYKPLLPMSLDQYRQLVPRDHPDMA
jgi:ribosomal protein S18 acetylase RimI-like enzyme